MRGLRWGVAAGLFVAVAACGGGGSGGEGDGGFQHTGDVPDGSTIVPDADASAGIEVPPPSPDAGLAPPPHPKPPLGEYPAAQQKMSRFELYVAPADLARLDADPLADVMVSAVVVLDGQAARGRIRYRGASTRTLPQKSYRIELNAGYYLDGRNDFKLLAEYLDSGKLSEKFAIDTFIAMGAPVPWGKYALLSVNGENRGVYLDMENVGGEYLAATGSERDAWIYRAGGRNGEMKIAPAGSYQQDWSKTSGEADPSTQDLKELLRFINRTDDDVFERDLGRYLDVDAYLGNLAVDALISNNLIEDARGYWVHELHRDRWTYVPWDLNNARLLFYRDWAVTDPPIVNRHPMVFTAYDPMVEAMWNERHGDPAYQPTWSVLNTRIWDRPAFRDRIISKIQLGLNGPLTEAKADAEIDGLWKLINAELFRDPYVDAAHARVSVDFLKQYVRGRRTYLNSMIGKLRAHGSDSLVINEVGFGNPGYIELLNRGSSPISLGGLAITNDLRKPQLQILPAGLEIAAGGRMVLVADGDPSAGPEHLAFTIPMTGGELGIFDGVRVWGPIDAVYFGPHADGTAYGRVPDASENLTATVQTPGAPN